MSGRAPGAERHVDAGDGVAPAPVPGLSPEHLLDRHAVGCGLPAVRTERGPGDRVWRANQGDPLTEARKIVIAM